tara:strand:- start:125 stop:784 length:660 start_codon:yes stop_codon:yes gene_type:complete
MLINMEVEANSRGLLSTQINKKYVLNANILVIIFQTLNNLFFANLIYDEIFAEYALFYIFGSTLLIIIIIGIPLIAFYLSSNLLSKLFLLLLTVFYLLWFLQRGFPDIAFVFSGDASGFFFISISILATNFVMVLASIINLKHILTYSDLEEVKDESNEIIDKETLFMLYSISLLIPIAGIIIGAMYVSRNEKELQSVGKNCLVCSLFSMLLLIFIFLI